MTKNFKVGDKVQYTESEVIADVIAVGDEMLFVKVHLTRGQPYETATKKEFWKHIKQLLPTPPEGREMEAEMRHVKRGDEYWDGSGWARVVIEFYGDYYCLRPLPPKPEGEGWEWRKPQAGDEAQMIDSLNRPSGYRWCRAKPKVKRWMAGCFVDDVCFGELPFVDTGTGPRLDTDKIGREWAIKWLNGRYATMHTDRLADELRKEQEASNVND